ncbi:MAG: hypothetical protein R6U59_06455 [Eubacteriales bacterium]
MLKEISIKSIISSKIDSIKPSIKYVRLKKQMQDIGKEEIENIIINNINIQYGLASLYPYRFENDFTSTFHMLGLLSERDHSQQINSIKNIFNKVTVVNVNNELCALQVSNPTEEVLDTFFELSLTASINRLITHFMMRSEIEDVSQIIGFKYILEEHDVVISEYANRLNKDDFFRYIRYNKRNKVAHKCIPLRGFTLKEIETDTYIRDFSILVKSLYVYVSKDIKDQLRYVKFLTWDEL